MWWFRLVPAAVSGMAVATAAAASAAAAGSMRAPPVAQAQSASAGPAAAVRQVDVAIIGAGIVGLATAREIGLRYPSKRVCVIEKEAEPAAHQTGHNSGVIHAGIYYKPGSLMAQVGHKQKNFQLWMFTKSRPCIPCVIEICTALRGGRTLAV